MYDPFVEKVIQSACGSQEDFYFFVLKPMGRTGSATSHKKSKTRPWIGFKAVRGKRLKGIDPFPIPNNSIAVHY